MRQQGKFEKVFHADTNAHFPPKRAFYQTRWNEKILRQQGQFKNMQLSHTKNNFGFDKHFVIDTLFVAATQAC